MAGGLHNEACPDIAGHRKGADAVRRTIETAPQFGIHALTLYAFSSDNWKRPAEEVSALMRLFEQYLESEVEECSGKMCESRLSDDGTG